MALRDPWRGQDPQIKSIVRIDERCLGMRLKLASGEDMTMPLGPTSFHMSERRFSQPRKLKK